MNWKCMGCRLGSFPAGEVCRECWIRPGYPNFSPISGSESVADVDPKDQQIRNPEALVTGFREAFRASQSKLAQMQALVTQMEADSKAELNGRIDLRTKHGALASETFPEFVERLAKERDEAYALLERHGKDGFTEKDREVLNEILALVGRKP